MINVLERELAPIRERRARYEKDIPGVYEILKKGTERANEVADATLREVKEAMKINYFEDKALMADQVQKYS